MKRPRRDHQRGAAAVSVAPPVWQKEAYPVIEDGRLIVRVVEIQGPEWLRTYQRWSLRLGCEGIYEPVSLSLFLALPGDRSGPGVPGRQSKYYLHWTMANGVQPKKGEVMDWKIFLGKAFTAEVKKATKNAEGEEKSEEQVYSVIVCFVRREEM